jgi:hypothetical protein
MPRPRGNPSTIGRLARLDVLECDRPTQATHAAFAEPVQGFGPEPGRGAARDLYDPFKPERMRNAAETMASGSAACDEIPIP